MTDNLNQRKGDVEKCPCCGSPVDAQAYFCTACRNYFCYHCRARVLPGEETYQCVNQRCDYYGKLVCTFCDPKQQQEEPPVVFAEPEDGYWPLLLVLSLIGGLVAWWKFSLVLWSAVGVMAAVFALLAAVAALAGMSVFGRIRNIEHKRLRVYHTCLHCLQETKKSRSA